MYIIQRCTKCAHNKVFILFSPQGSLMSYVSVGFYHRQKFSPREEYVTDRQMKIHPIPLIHLHLPTTASRREPAVATVDTPQESSQTCGSHAMAPLQDGELLERLQTEIQVHYFRYGAK